MLKTRRFDQPPRHAYESSVFRRLFPRQFLRRYMELFKKHLHFGALGLLVAQACAAGASDHVPESAENEAVAAGPPQVSEQRPSNDSGDPDVNPTGKESSEGPSLESAPDGSASEEVLPIPPGTKVLHIGDSFAGALGKPLGELFETAGMRSVLKHTDSSYLTDWAWDGNLTKYLWKYNPDLVIVTLGANELEIVKPELREKTVKKIVDTIGERPCVWIAIPLWEGPKNGLLDVIKAHSAPCIYMDTNELFDTTKMARIRDGIHPTTAARKAWADDVFLWLKERRSPTPDRPWDLGGGR